MRVGIWEWKIGDLTRHYCNGIFKYIDDKIWICGHIEVHSKYKVMPGFLADTCQKKNLIARPQYRDAGLSHFCTMQMLLVGAGLTSCPDTPPAREMFKSQSIFDRKQLLAVALGHDER